jgi:SpoVK/Ycf46/Vps4 family AAA+-type ATPase
MNYDSQEEIEKAKRMISRAGMPLDEPESDDIQLGETDVEKRKMEVDTRKNWEEQFSSSNTPNDISMTIHDKINLETEMSRSNVETRESTTEIRKRVLVADAEKIASELTARAGAGTAFDGDVLGIGGLDEVLRQVKRRVWVPLAAPPSLLKELGTHPVRGLLFYGLPGCGKTLLARSLGKILSPARPPTVISGPEVMDRFVGSSEANIRKIFDDPPEIYDSYRLNTPDNGKALEKAALHVIIMDEFDAIARTRGGQDGKGDQGDAGVARDSVVNQLLAKMDGVEPLPVPTLVIGLTNKRSLIDKALLRPVR